jgi:protein-tyrosine phosphatase
MGDSHFDVAFICTGNRFRSPLAAALLSAETERLPVTTSSLGIVDLRSSTALPEALDVAGSFGLDLSEHRTRCISEVDLESVDLVLGFERAHVHAATVDGHARIEHTFTLPELVELLQAVRQPLQTSTVVERARGRIEAAHALRPPVFRSRRVSEIPDPLGRSASAQRRIAEEVRDFVSRLAAMLFR